MFSNSIIIDTLKGTSFSIKLDVLLPLLDVNVPDRIRNAALQCKSIRNMIVHNKVMPALMSDVENRASDGELLNERSQKFFLENPVEYLQADLRDFTQKSVSENTAMQLSHSLFEKHFMKQE